MLTRTIWHGSFKAPTSQEPLGEVATPAYRANEARGVVRLDGWTIGNVRARCLTKAGRLEVSVVALKDYCKVHCEG